MRTWFSTGKQTVATALLAALLAAPLPAAAPRQTPSGAGWKIPFHGSDSQPVAVDGVVYLGSFDGAVYALDARTGGQKWRFQTGEGLTSGPEIIVSRSSKLEDQISAALAAQKKQKKGKREIHGTPVIRNETVYIGSMDHNFYALATETGELRWSFPTGGPVLKAAIVEEDAVYFSSDEEQGTVLYAVDAASGEKKWIYSAQGWVTNLDFVMKDYVVYVAHTISTEATKSRGGRRAEPGAIGIPPATRWVRSELHALDAMSGAEKWVFGTESGLLLGGPVIRGSRVFFSTDSEDGSATLYALEASSGIKQWEATTRRRWGGARGAQILAGSDLLYFNVDGNFHAFDPETGELRWKLYGKNLRNASLGELLYVGGGKIVFGLDPLSGQQRWTTRVGGYPWIRSVINGVVYATSGNSLNAIDGQTGKRLWKFKTGGLFKGGEPFAAGPVKLEEWLFFATRTSLIWGEDPIQGHLYCVDAKTGKVR